MSSNLELFYFARSFSTVLLSFCRVEYVSRSLRSESFQRIAIYFPLCHIQYGSSGMKPDLISPKYTMLMASLASLGLDFGKFQLGTPDDK